MAMGCFGVIRVHPLQGRACRRFDSCDPARRRQHCSRERGRHAGAAQRQVLTARCYGRSRSRQFIYSRVVPCAGRGTLYHATARAVLKTVDDEARVQRGRETSRTRRGQRNARMVGRRLRAGATRASAWLVNLDAEARSKHCLANGSPLSPCSSSRALTFTLAIGWGG